MADRREHVRLPGCRSRPIIGYLKALGVLRTVSRQADPTARGRWAGGIFELRGELDGDGLERFFLQHYAPAPIVSPWNGASGFFPKDPKAGFETIEASDDERLAAFRRTIGAARAVLIRLGMTEKRPDGDAKTNLLRELRATLSDDAIEWLDAAVVLVGTKAGYPSLLGSGGNDGHLEFANNYAQAVASVIVPTEGSSQVTAPAAWLKASLWAASVPLQHKTSHGHLLRDHSPVMSPLGKVDPIGNPWDLVLALEGTLLLAAGVSRRHGTAYDASLAAPFTVRPVGAGYGSAVAGEAGRDELWMPLWNGFSALAEVESMSREARVQIGRRAARTGLDVVRATAELGVARGISAFERYAILKRAGKDVIAVPAGRIDVRSRPEVSALRTLEPWLSSVLRYGDGKCPAAHRQAIHKLERAAFEFAQRGGSRHACAVHEQLGRLEGVLARAGARVAEAGLRPLRGAAAQPWLDAADDGTAELALATALVSSRDANSSRALPALRDYLHGTSHDDGGVRIYERQGRARVPQSLAPIARLAAIHSRRHRDAMRARPAGDAASLGYAYGMGCSLALIQRLAVGAVDPRRVLRLAEGLALLDFREARPLGGSALRPVPVPVLEMLALAWWGNTIELRLSPRPGWAARLAAGAIHAVLADAFLRLRMAELPPLVTAGDLRVAALRGPVLGAALLLRPRKGDLRAIADRMTFAQANQDQGAPA